MEASGHARWFERLLAELNVELCTGDAAKIRAKRVRKKKTDGEDARHILQLMLKDDFPKVWIPSWDNRDVRQLPCNNSASLRASIRSLLFPYFSRAFFRGLQTTSWATCG